ncbi:DUF1294 domain-containing protein [Shimia sp. R9_1]|uniref:DUF1294 domain-containing protein n=1 Tax=Shimia sp. R9_1 TaxID=2821111 RepID=UPI001ADB0DC6|nr:DUF1294 domain-containing protein [Shimia sp. R9_1]MBO9405851.1 DUF1294 domain-containing protein [Shimia sp. R9_1]
MNASSILVTSTAYLCLINLVCIAAFYLDKRRALSGSWRVPESRLLCLALIGGSPGAKWAQKRFRHKTRKQPFCTRLNRIVALQLVLIIGALLYVVT